MTDKKIVFDYATDFKVGFRLNPNSVLRSFVASTLSEKFQHFSGIPQQVLNNTLSKGFSVPGLQGTGDLGFGYFGAAGGANNASFFIRPVLFALRPSTANNPLSITGTLGAVSNLNFVANKFLNIGASVNGLVNQAFKDGLGINASLVTAEIQQVSTAFNDAVAYFESIGAEEQAKAFSEKINTINNIKNLSTDPSFATAESIEYLSFVLNQAQTEFTAAANSLAEIGSAVGNFAAIGDVLNTAVSETWNILNTGATSNNLIKSAFSIAGRLMQKDGTSGPYAWAAPFVLSTLQSAGVPGIDAVSPGAWTKWGYPVNINNPAGFKPNDLLIFKTVSGIMHMGFLKSFDPKTRKAVIMGGNQGGGAGAIAITLNTPFFSAKGRIPTGLMLAHVKRGWPTSNKAELPSDVPS